MPARAADREIAAALRLGCSVRGKGSVVVGGESFPRWALICDDNAIAIRLLDELGSIDAEESARVQLIARACVRGGEDVSGAVYRFVKGAVRYEPDREQVFQSSDVTLALGTANCVNATRLFLAIARAAGVGCRAMAVTNPKGEIVHVAPQVVCATGWGWCEVTIESARYGESPYDAAGRAGMIRDDLRALAASGTH